MSLNVVVFLYDNTGYPLSIPHGKSATTAVYFKQVVVTLGLPEDLANKCFSLWLKSSALG